MRAPTIILACAIVLGGSVLSLTQSNVRGAVGCNFVGAETDLIRT
jgi:hypothetical protein